MTGHDTGPIHTWTQNANRDLQAIPLMLLASSMDTPIHNSRFHLLAFAPARPVWIGPQSWRVDKGFIKLEEFAHKITPQSCK